MNQERLTKIIEDLQECLTDMDECLYFLEHKQDDKIIQILESGGYYGKNRSLRTDHALPDSAG